MDCRISRNLGLLLTALLAVILLETSSVHTCAAAQEPKHVFILNSFNRGYAWTDNELRGIDDTFVNSGLGIEPYETFMDTKRIAPTPQYFAQLKELIQTGYKGVRFEAVLACDNDAFEFVRRYRDELFPGVPVVFSALNDFDERLLDGRKDITGTSENVDYEGTLRCALKLFPKTTHIVVVVDGTTTGKAHRSAVEKIRGKFPKNLAFSYLSLADMTLDELAGTLSTLDSRSIVLLLQHFVDRNGATYTVQQSTPLLTQSSSVPVFVLADIRMGLGALGGHVVSGYHHGAAAAQMVVRILNGTDVASIPVLLDSPNKDMFDFRVMKRFGLAERDLPEGSLVINKQPSALTVHSRELLAFLGVFTVLCGILIYVMVEIGRRKLSEEALRKSRTLLQSVTEGTSEAIFVKDLDGRYLLFNAAAARFVGKSAQEVLGKDDTALFPPADARTVMDSDRRVMNSGVTQTIEEFLFAAGVQRTFQTTKGPVRDAQGQVVGMFGVSRDITEHRKAEEALRESEKALRALMNATTDAVILMDRHGTALAVNSVTARKLGRRVDELVGKCLFDFLPPDFAKSRKAKIDEVVRTGKPVRYEDERNGTIIDHSLYPVLDEQGNVVRVAVFGRDITERKRAEDELRHTQATLQAAMDQSTAGIAIADAPGGNLRYVNDAGLLIRGGDRHAVVDGVGINQYVSSWKLLDLDGRPLNSDEVPLARAVMFGETCSREFIIRRTEGDDRIVLAKAAPIRDESGRVVAGIVVFVDITDFKQAEKDKAQLEASLAQALKMESVGRLAGGVAHDFNNLLTGIMSYVELSRDSLPPEHPARCYLDEITVDAQRSASLTRQLLAFARKQQISPVPLNLNDVVSGMLTMLRRLIGEDIAIEWSPGPDLWPVLMDPSQIEQILTNLVVNARDAINGSGSISLGACNMTLDPAFCMEKPGLVPGDYACMTISDTGIGMTKEVSDHIFEPFFTTKGEGEGVGLGLATVYGIIKQNKGYIDVYSEVGMGTRFKIYLPRCTDPAAASIKEAAGAPAAKADQPRGSETILLVEDEKSIRITTHIFLKNLGYTMLVAEDPEEALGIAAKYPGTIHLLLTDVIMPGMNGNELFQQLSKLRPAIKGLFISGFTADIVAGRGGLDEGWNFLSKPFTRDVLARKVREVLEAQ